MTDTPMKSAAAALGEPFSRLLSAVPDSIAAHVTEITLRLGKSLSLTSAGKPYFLTVDGGLTTRDRSDLFRPAADDLDRCLFRLCNYSLHVHQKKLADGYLTLPDGHRAGVCGNAVFDTNGKLCSVRDITTIRLRVARSIAGAADAFSGDFFSGAAKNILFAGPPGCGKTTILRDLSVALSSGRYGTYYDVVLADERCELSAIPCKQALCLDAIRELPKANAVLQAVRTLRPDIVICDEIGSVQEAESFVTAVNSGVAVIASIHANSPDQLRNKPQYRVLEDHRVFDRIHFINGHANGTYKLGNYAG